MRITITTLAVILCATPMAFAQTPTVDHFTQSQLIDKAQELESKAQAADGSASAKLNEYPAHYTMIALRHNNGGGEIHENYADIFYVVQGSATLLTGGALESPKTVSPGEIRGTSVQNGTKTALSQGDVVHIPANTPHQMLVPKGSTFIYFVVKVKEK
jgi:mannose-6-phosphate isomerase-like protein (cupin superfamily)